MKIKKTSRILGFIIASLFLLIFMIIVIGAQLNQFISRGMPKELILPVILVLLCVVAVIFSFKKPHLCGWILISSGIIWIPYMLLMYGVNDIGALLFGFAFIVSGLLYLPWLKN